MRKWRLLLPFMYLSAVMVLGTVGFKIIEGYTWLDAAWFTIDAPGRV